jgi:hypothetical protein
MLRLGIQDRLLTSPRKVVRSLAYIIPVLTYIIIHSSYGWTGVIYAFVTGTFLTLYYLRKKDWLTFSLWHMLWGFIIVPLTMVACVFIDGPIRNDFLFAYKKRHIIKQKMHYQKKWGWVDTIHYRPDHFEHLQGALRKGEKSVSISDGWVTPLKIAVSFSCDYQIKQSENALENWAIITGMMLDFMYCNESVQEGSPWYHGNQLSAWQFDDMSSALLCCLDRLPQENALDLGEKVYTEQALMKLWNEQGENLVGLKVKEEECWAMLSESGRLSLYELVKKMKSNWRRTSFSKLP